LTQKKNNKGFQAGFPKTFDMLIL